MGKKLAGNSKAEAANAKKAAAKAEKDKAKSAQAEALESEKWAQGSKGKSKKEAEAEKKAAQAAKKAEAARLLAEEEKSIPKPKGAAKTAAKRSAKADAGTQAHRSIPEFSASNIDDALDLLSLSDDKKGPVQSKEIDRHPERRFKAALAAYEERELPNFKKENPGLRLNQLKELIYKAFQKSPENPFNQANVLAYNATQEDAQAMKEKRRQDLENRLRTA